MDVEIKIPKRLYDDMEQYCKANNLVLEKYCALVLRKQLALDKYGDLNEKFTPRDKEVEEVKINILDPKPVVKPEVKETPEAVVEVPQEFPKEEKRKHRIIETK